MTNLYFEELQIGIRSAAGPYSLSKEEIIRFAKQYDPIPRHIDEELAAPEGAKGKFAEKSMLDPCPVRLPIQKPSGPRGERREVALRPARYLTWRDGTLLA